MLNEESTLNQSSPCEYLDEILNPFCSRQPFQLRPYQAHTSHASNQLFTGQGNVDGAAIGRLLDLDSTAVNCTVPPYSSVTTTETPLERSGFETISDCPANETEVSYFELPKAQVDYHDLRSPQGETLATTSIKQEKCTQEVNLDTAITEPRVEQVDNTGRIFQILASMQTEEIRNWFHASDADITEKIGAFWRNYQPLLRATVEGAQSLVSRRGVKMKRRKRIGANLSAIEKKEIRAQRNRERSQALRRHQKQRLLDLESITEELKTYNKALKSLINCLFENDVALPRLNEFFTSEKCSELLVGFMNENS